MFSVLPLAMFVFKVGKLIYLYHSRVGANTTQTIAAALAGLSLTHTIGRAILAGFLVRSKPFFRTPKRANQHALFKALGAAREETLLLIQAIPYASTLIIAIISALPDLPASWIGETGSMQQVARTMLGAPTDNKR